MDFLLNHHQRSVDESILGAGSKSLRSSLESFGDHLARSLGGHTLEGLKVGSPSWRDLHKRPAWMSTVRLVIAAGDGTYINPRLCTIPWLTGESAAEDLDKLRRSERSVGLLEDVCLGTHDGLFVNQPLTPVAQMRQRPGIHVVARTQRGEPRNAVLIVPDAGGQRAFLHAPSRSEDRLRWPGAQRSLSFADARLAARDSETGIRYIRSIFGAVGILPYWFSPDTAGRIESVTGYPLVNGSLTALHLDWILDALTGASPDSDADPRNTQFRFYGDLVMDAVWSGIQVGLATSTQVATPAAVAIRIHGEVQRLIDGLTMGREGGTAAIPTDPINTLAWVDERRTVSRFGPGGLPRPWRGSAGIRDLHPAWRGALCPLQTRESEDIGLIRHFANSAELDESAQLRSAVGDRSAWWDLSAAPSLVPLINHNDLTRAAIGSRILKQAVPLVAPQAPLIRSGYETTLAENAGICRSSLSGRVVDVQADAVVIASPQGERRSQRFGPSALLSDSKATKWASVVQDGDSVRSGDILAMAPDVVLDGEGEPTMAMGVNCLVGYLPWHGLNFEDAIVISASLADRMSSVHVTTISERLAPSQAVVWTAPIGRHIEAGETIARLIAVGPQPDEDPELVVAPLAGTVLSSSIGLNELKVRIAQQAPLEVGDKLANRHGNKGVISTILPPEEMPHLEDGTPIEMILNPIGALRRLNLGQFFETHLGLLARISGQAPDPVGRALGNPRDLATALEDRGVPGGRLDLFTKDSTPLALHGDVGGAVVGLQYFMKLDHRAADKRSARYRGQRSARSQQPLSGSMLSLGRPIGGPQRMGEMELWGLQAAGVLNVLEDTLVNRSDRPQPHRPADVGSTFRSVLTHLLSAGIHLEFELADGQRLSSTESLMNLRPDDIVAERWRIWDEVAEGGALLQDLAIDQDGRLSTAGMRRILTTAPPREHPLHDSRHGGFLEDSTCPCGAATSQGERCAECHGTVTAVPTNDRYAVTHGIRLVVPVTHPWFHDGDVSINVLPLLPPSYRTFGHHEPLDRRYLRVYSINRWLGSLSEPDALFDEAAAALYRAVADVLGDPGDPPERRTLAARLGGKAGLLRRGLLGRATDLSARGVIVPNPSLHPEQVGLPVSMFEALRVGRPIEVPGQHLDVVLLNRQPTLHPYNLVALKAIPVPGSAITIHPMLCDAIAGDFDGDTVAIHRMLDPIAQKEAWNRLRPAANLRSAANGRPLPTVSLDIALGLHLLSGSPEGQSKLAAHVESHPAPPGDTESMRPADLLDGCLQHSPEVAAECAAALIRLGFEGATGWSVTPLEYEALDPIEAARMDPGALTAEVQRRVTSTSVLGAAVAAGAAGKLDGLVHTFGHRPPAPDFRGNRPDSGFEPGNLWFGLPDDLFFYSAGGGLAALGDKKLATPHAGSLTKALAEACYDVVVSTEDCGAAEPRSVISCIQANPCRRCIGPLPGSTQPPEVGSRIGLLSAMLIGERGTQLAMRAFHGGGTGERVATRLDQLWGLFGRGEFEDLDGQRNHLSGMVADLAETGDGDARQLRLVLLGGLVKIFENIMGNDVDPVYASVVLRRIVDAAIGSSSRRGGPLTAAAISGAPLVDATSRGQLRWITEAAAAGAWYRRAGGHSLLKEQLILGGPVK